ncbi:MAG: protein translocase subunit SecD [Coriobacteriia bacterium]
MDPKTRNAVALAVIIVLVAVSFWAFWPLNEKITQGLDIKGGLSVILTAKPTGSEVLTEAGMDRAETILTERVNALGVSEATVQRQGDRSFLVQIPGIKDSKQALAALGSTGQLLFLDARSINTTTQLEYGVIVPEGSYEATGVILTGANVKTAGVTVDSNNRPAVSLDFDPTGTSAWGTFTTANIGQYVVILLDNQVQSVAQIQDAITDGQTLISGTFTPEEAKRLSAVLQAGALPFALEFSESRVVGPTLGQDSLNMGLVAGLIGLALVGVFMVVYYRGFGVVSALALAIYGALMMGTLAVLSAAGAFSVTLPGIAGLILTIGVAADTSILIFERFKEEVEMGKVYRTAAKSGVRHAIGTSIDADIVTLVSAIALYIFAIGPVRGFAFTLILGIVLDLVVALLFTGPIVRILAETWAPKMPALFGLKGGEQRG